MTSESTEHEHLDRLNRDALDPGARAVADVLEEWLHRQHGILSGSHGVGLFLDLLADNGYSVVETGETRHLIDFRADGWTIKHPLACRPNLFDCPVNRAAEQQITGEPASGLGTYAVTVDRGLLCLEATDA